MRIHPIILFCLLCLVLFVSGHGQTTTKPVYKLKDVITLDGLLDEPDWDKASEVNELLHPHPDRVEPARTSVKVLFNERSLYIGFLCNDSDPGSITAEITQKDADIRYDDSVYVLIDATQSLDFLFFFATNPLGSRSDGTISRDGQVIDALWDGTWQVAAKKTDFGWSVELAIDLTEMGITPAVGTGLSLSLSRVIPRLDSSFWTEPLDPAFQISTMGALPRISFESDIKRASAEVYGLAGYENGVGGDGSAGFKASYLVTQNISAHVILNSEFDTVEDDEEFFNLTRYEPNIPEKREFFKEQEEFFKSRLPIFYSKRIGDIYGGIRVLGESDSYAFTGMSVQSKKDDDLDRESENFSAFSLRKNFLGESSVRVMAVNRLLEGENTGATAVDASFSFFKGFKLSGQFAMSYGAYKKDNLAYSVGPSYDTETFHFHALFQKVDPRFGDNVNDFGYIYDDDRREIDSSLVKSFNIGKSGVEKLNYSSNYNVYWGQDDTLRSWRIDQGLSVDTSNNFFIGFNHMQEYKLFEIEYRNQTTDIYFGWDSKQWQMFTLAVTLGKNFGRRYRMFQISKRLYLSQKISFEYKFNSLNYPLLGGNRTRKTFFIHRLRSTYEIHENLTFKIFGQMHSTPTPRKFNVQTWLIYRFLPPAGTVTLCYQKGDGPFGLTSVQGSTFLIKLSYGF